MFEPLSNAFMPSMHAVWPANAHLRASHLLPCLPFPVPQDVPIQAAATLLKQVFKSMSSEWGWPGPRKRRNRPSLHPPFLDMACMAV